MNTNSLLPNQQKHVINVYSDETYEFKPRPKDKRPHTRMPPICSGKTPNREPDLLDLLGNLSKGARDLFLNVKRKMDFVTYTATLSNKNLTQSQKNKRSQAIQELESTGYGLAQRVPQSGLTNVAGIELRFKPSTFILSPEYIFPNPKHSEEIVNNWNQCKENRKLKSAIKT